MTRESSAYPHWQDGLTDRRNHVGTRARKALAAMGVADDPVRVAYIGAKVLGRTHNIGEKTLRYIADLLAADGVIPDQAQWLSGQIVLAQCPRCDHAFWRPMS